MNFRIRLLNGIAPAIALPASLLALPGESRGEILVNLLPAEALYDSAVKGIVNDQGNGPGVVGNQSGIPLIDNAGDHKHSSGFTFNIEFSPLAADLTGTKLLIELGGNSNGAGLYLIGGVPTLLSKQGSTVPTVPTSLNDTTLNSIGVQSSIGTLEAGVSYSFSASWNHAGTLELIVAAAGGSEVFNSFAITGVPGNWSGNDTLSVKTLASGNAGGLGKSDATTTVDPRFSVDSAGNFAGTITRAIFWNKNDVTPLTLTAPVVKGFTVTRLPGTNKLRFHWNISEGGLPNPTTAVIRDTANPGGPAVYTIAATSLVGFVDIESSIADFTLAATNATGAANAAAVPEVDTSHSSVVRSSIPLAWYRFNEKSGSRHLVDSAENVTPNDGEVIGQSFAGGNGYIDGAGTFIGAATVLGKPILNPGSTDPLEQKGFTVETVIKHASGAAGSQVAVAQTDVDGTGRIIIGVQADGTLYTVLGGTTRTSTAKLVPDEWQHVALVVDPDHGQLRWYVNGQSGGTNTPAGGLVLESSVGSWVIGSAKSLAGSFWSGGIDEVAVYRALLDDQNRDGDLVDSKISTHYSAWYQLTKGIIRFRGSAGSVNTGSTVDLQVFVGADVTSASVDNGIGAVTLTGGYAAIPVSPTATTTYTLTANGPGGATYTSSFTLTYNQLTAPVVLGFEATSLPTTSQVRLHWAVTAGDFPTPVNIALTWGAGSSGTFAATSLRGFHDIPAAEAVNLNLRATNFVGQADVTASAPAPDNSNHSPVIRAAAPVAWYRFNEAQFSGLIVDSAENAAPHNGVLLANSPAISNGDTGFVDKAATFNASSGVITDRVIDFYDENLLGYTVEAIVQTNPGTGTTNRVIVAQQDLNGTGRQILSVDDTGAVRSNLGGGVNIQATGTAPRSAWSHIVEVVDLVKNEVRWYIDGEFAGSGTPSTFVEASDGAWTIGVHKTLLANFWRGKIDELIVYDKILDNPDNDELTNDSLIPAHRNAWWARTSGVIYNGPETATIDAGGFVDFTIKAGADVTGVTIDGYGPVTLGGGRGVARLSPATTTTYTVTYQTASGPITRTITITVNGGTVVVPLKVVSTEISGGNFIIRYTGAANTTYAVKGSETLGTFPTSFGDNTTDASGNGIFSTPVDAQKTRQFFRIETKQ